jgi:hypothetical protein
MDETTTAEGQRRGGLVELAVGDEIGGPIRMALHLAESLFSGDGFHPADVVKDTSKK